MEHKHQVHNLIILDESGSMESIKKTIIEGFNELVQTVKGIEKEFTEQEHLISLLTFNSFKQEFLHFSDPIGKLEPINETRYQPYASTPLYDAIGFSIGKLRQKLENQTDYNVLVTILTDGAENASKEYTGVAIRNLIEELKLSRWTFTYIGTDHDVENSASLISITNTISFKKNDAGLKGMFARESSSRSNYSHKIRFNEDTTDNFYEDKDFKK